MKSFGHYKNFILLVLVSAGSMVIAGYHPGVEDDAVYLSAIQRRLHPGLYPHDARFFTLQMQASVFDRLMAALAHLTHLPVSVLELAVQFLTAFAVLWGCRSIARRCFPTPAGQWAAVALVGVLFTMPVAGTALFIFDPYLHPRAIATALILAAILGVLDRRPALVSVLMVTAVLMHPIMGVFGASYCAILWLTGQWFTVRGIGGRRVLGQRPSSAMAVAAFGFVPSWIFEKPSAAWREALSTRNYYFLGRWTWYEWLGVIAPIFILWAIARYARRSGRPAMAYLAGGGAVFAVFQLAAACIVLLTPALIRLTPMQPMRYLHLVYILMAVLGGGLIGEHLLRRSLWRWIALFLPLAAGMYIAQRSLFPGTRNLELPGLAPRNPWLEAFSWVRANTPVDAYFALDPYYMQLPDEDYHSFRALAERSELADAVKDAAVATQVPELAPAWQQQTQAVAGWRHFQKQDFLRLQQEFGVNWIVVARSGIPGLDCPYHNRAVAVCKL
ncbi:MAG TPA: hypothetical protein VHX37_18010 [Acidobacteriaceae bacterium]|nr:hypothetical protein [Acidobacteriaceae bacterium]